MRTLSQKTVDGITYSGGSVVIATMLIYVLVTYRPELANIKEILIAGLTPILNGIAVFVKNKWLTK